MACFLRRMVGVPERDGQLSDADRTGYKVDVRGRVSK
jgi:hypothetical protein